MVKVISFGELFDYLGLLKEHWKEVPFGKFKIDLDIDEAAYNTANAAGLARCYGYYDEHAVLAGYMVIMIAPMMHHKGKLQAITDSFYIVPEERDKGAFSRMLDYAEQDIKKGTEASFLGIVVNNNFDIPEEYLNKKGYQKTETIYTKEVK